MERNNLHKFKLHQTYHKLFRYPQDKLNEVILLQKICLFRSWNNFLNNNKQDLRKLGDIYYEDYRSDS